MMDTLSLLPDDWAGKFDSRYRVVLVAAQRAKYLMQGAKRSQLSKFTKETSVALEEVLQGNVEFLMGKEARQALKEVRKTVEREFDESLLGETDEDAKEIKQQLSMYIDDSPKEEVVEPEIHE
jgi:DNA-directed RNA polymerase subunit omega